MQSNLLTAVTRKTNFVLPTKLEEELSVFVCGIRIRMQNFEEVAAPQKAAEGSLPKMVGMRRQLSFDYIKF